MLVVFITSLVKKKDASQKLAGFMLAIVLGNIGMWIVGKITTWNFELLAATYFMSVLAYFFVYILLQDYIRKVDVPAPTMEKTRVIVLDSIPLQVYTLSKLRLYFRTKFKINGLL